jgi:hypothetical protein
MQVVTMAVAAEEMVITPEVVVELQMFALAERPIQIANLWQVAEAEADTIVVLPIMVELEVEQPVERVISAVVKVHILELVETSQLVVLIKVVWEHQDLLVKAVMVTILMAAAVAAVIMVVVALVTAAAVVVLLGETAQQQPQ